MTPITIRIDERTKTILDSKRNASSFIREAVRSYNPEQDLSPLVLLVKSIEHNTDYEIIVKRK